jgi:hypothetical protein
VENWSEGEKAKMIGEYFFKNRKQNARPAIYDYKSKGWIQTEINSRVRGGLRWNEWDALKLNRLLIKEKLFPIVWKEDLKGNITVRFG